MAGQQPSNSGTQLLLPMGLHDDLLRDLQATGMYEFAQTMGAFPSGLKVDPDLPSPHPNGGMGAEHPLGTMNGHQLQQHEPAPLQRQQSAASHASNPSVQLPNGPSSNGATHQHPHEQPLEHAGHAQPHPQQQQQQNGLHPPAGPDRTHLQLVPPPHAQSPASAGAVNCAADAAVEQALAAIAAARERMQGLEAEPSRSKSSEEPPDAPGEESSSLGRRGSARRASGRASASGAGPSQQAAGGGLAGLAAAAGAASAAGNKPSKGLRHFSMKVCEKVESKGTTTYNEVADELVAEMKGDDDVSGGAGYDEKNIRRRVYDAINVLMALDIIAKEKKAIMWRGFPNAASRGASGNGAALNRLLAERAAQAQAVERKAAELNNLVEQQRALQFLLQRNEGRAPGTGAGSGTALQLPFILVQAKPDATVEVQISENMQDVQFDFYNSPFQIHDDSYVLRMMAEEAAREPEPLVQQGSGVLPAEGVPQANGMQH